MKNQILSGSEMYFTVPKKIVWDDSSAMEASSIGKCFAKRMPRYLLGFSSFNFFARLAALLTVRVLNNLCSSLFSTYGFNSLIRFLTDLLLLPSSS
mmetsp:Transcript_54660/g.61881  ORF Transcript_54660/g.61881 Transcript_54660/m.61881 type:complete len:96 (-) Transcript_54660:858-1145(-)